MSILGSSNDAKQILQRSKTVVILGVHNDKSKAAYYVPHYLSLNGFEIFPVNPVFTGETLFTKETKNSLSEINVAIDVVTVFRRSEHLEAHLEDILAMRPLPKVVWFQIGIVNNEIAKQLSDAGIDVIQDRCMLADHQYLL